MALLHKNSPKRIYLKDAIYFITTKTKENIPFFKNSTLAQLLIEEIRIAKCLKKFSLFAFVVLYDHIHLLIQPNGKHSISQIMFTIKKQFSHEANRIIGANSLKPAPMTAGGQTFARLREYVQNNSQLDGWSDHPRQPFAWQSSFHDHIIRDQKDFNNHVNYIHINPVKHRYVDKPQDWPWSSYLAFNNGNSEFVDPSY